MRAIWYNLPKWNFDSDNTLEKGKAEWRDGFKSKLDDLAYKEALGKLPAHLLRNPAYEVTLNQLFLLMFLMILLLL